jgi:hypothetical protein
MLPQARPQTSRTNFAPSRVIPAMPKDDAHTADAEFDRLLAGEHPAFPAPRDRDAKIWRYLDFAKFVWMLDRRRLSMPHCTLMEDPFEGTTPQRLVEDLEQRAQREQDRARIERLRRLAGDFRKGYFVSSWHINDVESEAMWKLFSASTNAVALQTTFARLRQALPPYVGVGMVRYIDYRREALSGADLFQWIMHKRKSFAHEQEVRAVASLNTPDGKGGAEIRAQSDEFGFYPKVDLEALIEAVRVHPLAEPWFIDLVGGIVERFGLNLSVRRSEMAIKPLL